MQKRRSKIKKENRLIKLFSIRLDCATVDYYCIISNYNISNKLPSTCIKIIDYFFACIQEFIL